ncbi:MAG TPA: RNA polymerase sigma factor [Opitutus sp.]|nr:RNA polymerase sigma factor [Opitutus sp.]
MNAQLNSSGTDDSRLVERHMAGDAAAFREIVERHQGMVCALAYSTCGDVARSEDVAQEVFVTAWKQLPQLREPAKLRGWLGGITRHLAHDALRRDGRTPTARADELSPETAADVSGPREHAIGSDETALMWSALEGLPETYREPMVLFYREGQSAGAVAAALEISEETARQRLARGRAMLTERMARIVEDTLQRSRPTAVFTGMVMVALPVGPVAVEAALGGGGAAGKALAAAGAVGSAAAKGGIVFKFLAAVAFLPAVLQGAGDFVQFNERNASVADGSARRQAAKAYLWANACIGGFVLGVMLVANWVRPSGWMFVLIGVWVIGAVWLSVRARCRMERFMAGVPKPAPGAARGFEARSEITWLGLPLFHVRIGSRPVRNAPVVKGWIAISDRRAVGGLFAFGPIAVAPLSMGIVGVGLISVSVAALGLVAAMGIAAAGWWSAGLATAGGFAAKGIWAVAPQFTSGASAFAAHAGDAAAKAFFQTHWFYRFTSESAWVLFWAGVLGWVMPVVLTGWQLWRTRAAK